MLRTLGFVFTACLALPPAAAAQVQQPAGGPQGLQASPGARVAYFSPQRAFAESAAGKAAQAKLASFQEEKTREVEARNNKLQQQIAAFKQTESVLGAAARESREQEIRRFEIDVKRFMEDAQAQFLGIQKEVESAFMGRLRPALREVALARDILLVFNEDTGLFAWVDPSLDLTPEVVKRLDQP